MRILNVTESYAPFYEFGGPPAKVEALSKGLVERGHEVTVLTADWGLRKRIGEGPREKAYEKTRFGWSGEDHGAKAIYLPTWLRYRATSWNPAIGPFLTARLEEFGIVHIFGIYDLLGPAVAKACRKRRLPYVLEPIGMYVPIVRNVLLKKLYHRIYGNELAAGAARVIATSDQEVQELAESGIAREKIELRRNGVTQPKRLPDKGYFRRKIGKRDQDLVVLFLGRLSEKKSPEMLLKAFAAQPERIDGREVQLIFAGPDEQGMETRLKNAAQELRIAGRVTFAGPTFGDDKWAAYRDADVFVLPSQNENFGNAAAEAATAGTPVIMTENCGVAPFLKEAGLIIRHDEAELTRAMAKLLEDEALRRKLSAQAIDAAAKIGWEEPVREMEVLYRKLAQFQ
jgi:glycosyltransferase involved in cell wall biosynthesis